MKLCVDTTMWTDVRVTLAPESGETKAPVNPPATGTRALRHRAIQDLGRGPMNLTSPWCHVGRSLHPLTSPAAPTGLGTPADQGIQLAPFNIQGFAPRQCKRSYVQPPGLRRRIPENIHASLQGGGIASGQVQAAFKGLQYQAHPLAIAGRDL